MAAPQVATSPGRERRRRGTECRNTHPRNAAADVGDGRVDTADRGEDAPDVRPQHRAGTFLITGEESAAPTRATPPQRVGTGCSSSSEFRLGSSLAGRRFGGAPLCERRGRDLNPRPRLTTGNGFRAPAETVSVQVPWRDLPLS